MIALVMFAAALALAPAPDRTLDAIRQVENVKVPAKRGPAGELGYYRITPAVWKQHSSRPFALCGTDPVLELAVAQAHLAWLRSNLSNPTPERLGMAWNAGLGAVQRGTVPAAAQDYGRRVANLVRERLVPAASLPLVGSAGG